MENNLNIFDTSSLTSQYTNGMSKDELVQEVMPKLQNILVNRFSGNPQKQKIKIYKDRISFAAPCCGDSAKDNSKKRGNLILEGKYRNMYKCHNCGVSMSLYNFFKRYGEGLSLRAIDYIVANKTISTFSVQDSSMNLLYDVEVVDEFAIDREYFKEKCHLEECNTPGVAYYYLIDRKQYDLSKFLFHRKYNLLFILNLTTSGKIIGLQVRNLNKYYKGPKYKTYKLSKIYDMLLHEPKEIPDEIEKLSMAFNILLVKYEQPVTIVEGPMDSFLIPNCIAICGAGHHVNFMFRYKFLFDDDETGRKHAIEKLNEGYEVFMWDKFKQDYKLPSRKKWDINDVVIWCSNNNIPMPNLNKYYSSDSLDLLDI